MGDLVNLKRIRKQRARAEAAARAAGNRASFGRTKAERRHAAGEVERGARALDGKRLGGTASTGGEEPRAPEQPTRGK